MCNNLNNDDADMQAHNGHWIHMYSAIDDLRKGGNHPFVNPKS
jgi:hypothetical protein